LNIAVARIRFRYFPYRRLVGLITDHSITDVTIGRTAALLGREAAFRFRAETARPAVIESGPERETVRPLDRRFIRA